MGALWMCELRDEHNTSVCACVCAYVCVCVWAVCVDEEECCIHACFSPRVSSG